MTSKFTKAFLTASLIFLGATSMAQAAGSDCQIIYGGGETCPKTVTFTIDKKVQKPTKGGEYVDNLTVNDARYQVGQDIVFKVTVQNTGTQKVNLSVVDTLPGLLTFVSGGGYDKASNTVSNAVALEAGQSKELTIVAKSQEPSNAGTTCVTNAVKATDTTGVTADDSAQVCIEKGQVTPKVFTQVPPKSIPSTGPELFTLIGLIPAGAAGFYLRKKAQPKADQPMAEIS